MFFSFFFFPSETPWSLVLQGSLNSSWRWGLCGRQAGCRAGRRSGAGRWIETRSGIWTSLTLCCFFSYPLGQCQQLEEPGKSERCELWEQPTPTGEGEKKKNKKRSVCLYYSQSVCLHYILQVGVAPKRRREVCPSTALCIAKENKPCCNNCKYYTIIPFRILWAHVLLRRWVARSLH